MYIKLCCDELRAKALKALRIAFFRFMFWASVLWTLFCCNVVGLSIVLKLSRPITPNDDTQTGLAVLLVSGLIAGICTVVMVSQVTVKFRAEIVDK